MEENKNAEGMSTLELIKAFEEKTIDPKIVSKKRLRDVTEVMLGRGDTLKEVSYTLKVTTRTVERYRGKIREQNSSIADPRFQKELMDDMVDQSRRQFNRLIKMSYSENAKASDVAKFISTAFGLYWGMLEYMGKLGYVKKSHPRLRVNQEEDQYEKWEERLTPMDKDMKIIKALTLEEREEIREESQKEEKDLREGTAGNDKQIKEENDAADGAAAEVPQA